MNTYRAQVRVAKSGGMGTMIVWAQVQAQNTINAKYKLGTLHERGNVPGYLL